ncbi:helix-turn-helix domain-containing protein [Virgibacillus sp. JSM 102003]|uniref:helix-turn-helix domain-containing protein n=1 Tax=Virgibacillus sp. JSM 102003 TaxID=1562108 RepID=UPI0035C25723
MLFDRIVIKCCSQFKTGRSVSAIYHLLKGKRSIQTVQDAHIYKLDNFYGIYKSLRKQNFDERIYKLISEGLIQLHDNSSAFPTVLGYKLNEKESDISLDYFNGMKYSGLSSIFFERLVLLVQTITNSRNNNLNFIPVVDKPVVTSWVKKEYYIIKQNQFSFLHQLYDELYRILSYFHEQEAGMFVDSLTGFKHYGMSSYQLAANYNLKLIDVPLALTGIIHYMLYAIEQDSNTYPLLTRIKDDLPASSQTSKSATKTKELLNSQYTAEEIAVIRNLKLNTIYDHLVELALYDKQFPLDKYIDKQGQQDILNAVSRLKSFKLKDIRQEISKEISYFQIRLVLAVENIT